MKKCRRFVFYNNLEKIREELALFFVEKRARDRAKEYAITCVAFDVIFVVFTLIDHSS